MSVTDSYRDLVVDQLRRVLASLRMQRMFGGVGLYAGELFFALIADDTLYFKTDETTRPAFDARGMPAFQPGGSPMAYHAVPDDVLEDVELLGAWARQAVEVARRAKGASRR